MLNATIALLALLATAGVAHAQTVVVVRHAERADAGTSGATMMATDPELSDAGRARAESLAAMLRDAGITAIFATEFKRTQQTAAPLAKRLGLAVETVASKDVAGLAEKVKAAKGTVLVVGHSNTVPGIINRLGIEVPVTIGESDYDDLFIVTVDHRQSLLRLHYR
jgi:broad specificity phosphatase PhoE